MDRTDAGRGNGGSAAVREGEVFRRLAAMVETGEAGVLATVTRTAHSTPRHAGSKMIVHADGSVTGSVGGGAAEARVIREAQVVLVEGQCRNLTLDLAGDLGVCGGSMEVFLEPVLSALPFWVIGAGHIGRALTELGRSLPFRFILVDDRPEFLPKAETGVAPGAVLAGPQDLGARISVQPKAAVLVASRSHELDGDYLAAIMSAEVRAGVEFGFLGGLGSLAKVAVLRRRFQDDPVLSARLGRVHLPVGLDLGSETPAEIAVSILAEVLAVLRERPLLVDPDGQPLGIRLHRRRQS